MQKILFVDDNEADRRAVKEALSSVRPDINLHLVNDGETALKFIFRKPDFVSAPLPDLILLDLNLSGIHGHEVLRQLKSDPEKKRIPVIILSSSSAQSDICKAYDLNANCYINKPLRYTELVKLMTMICDFWLKEVRYCYPA